MSKVINGNKTSIDRHPSNRLNPDLSKLIDANNDLGFRLLAWLAGQEAGKSVLISPFSLTMTLAMIYNGAAGKTKKALAELLELTGDNLQQINNTYANLLAMSNEIDPKVQLAIANSIWMPIGITPSPSFIQQIKEYYAGEVAHLDFRHPDAADSINKWVASKTGGKIHKLVTTSLVEPALLILMSVIYFKGIWTAQFDKTKTTERAFYRLDGSHQPYPMMWQSGHYNYYETNQFQAVSLPYGTGRMSLYIFLPQPTYSISDFQKALTGKKWQMWMSKFDNTKGNIILPRFRIAYEQELLRGLMALGGDEIAGMDFTGIGADFLLVSHILHQAVVEVNEEGTEAAAATAVMIATGMPPKSFTLTVDRPFFMAIRDNLTEAVWFAGFILDPAQASLHKI